MRTLLVMALVLLGVACSPADGSPCSTPNASQCAGGTSLLVCEGANWRAYPCPSCTGTTCDWKNTKVGAACPQGAGGDGWCPYNGRQNVCYWSSLADAGVFVESACGACVAGKTLAEVGACSGGHCACP
jgi:hypothetical protein